MTMTFKSYAFSTLQDCALALETAVSDGDIEWIDLLAEQCQDHEREMLANEASEAENASQAAFHLHKLCSAYSKLLQHQHIAHDSLDDSEIRSARYHAKAWDLRVAKRGPRFQAALVSI